MRQETENTRPQGVVMHACSLTRGGLQHYFNKHLPGFNFQACGSFREAGRVLALSDTELVVSDIRDDERDPLFGIDWLLWLQQVREDKPLVVMTEHVTESQWVRLSCQSSISLIALQTPEALLTAQLYQVMTGNQVISTLLAPPLSELTPCGALTESELRVFQLLHAGYSVTQVARRLHRSVKTVSAHKRNLMNKLRVDNEIALFARANILNESTGYRNNGPQSEKKRQNWAK